jgi:hypothetical protein
MFYIQSINVSIKSGNYLTINLAFEIIYDLYLCRRVRKWESHLHFLNFQNCSGILILMSRRVGYYCKLKSSIFKICSYKYARLLLLFIRKKKTKKKNKKKQKNLI